MVRDITLTRTQFIEPSMINGHCLIPS